MEYQTSSYFFPNNRHRIKTQFRHSPLHFIQRKQIRQNLSAYMMQQNNRLSRSSVYNNIKMKSQSQSRNSSCRKMRTLSSVIDNSQVNKNIGVCNILQKIRILKEQQKEMSNNPFYKIQKNRKSSKGYQSYIKRKQQANIKREKIEHIQSQPAQNVDKIFQNQVLNDISEEKTGKIRLKSQTVTYYEIKQYFQKKYCEKVDK